MWGSEWENLTEFGVKTELDFYQSCEIQTLKKGASEPRWGWREIQMYKMVGAPGYLTPQPSRISPLPAELPTLASPWISLGELIQSQPFKTAPSGKAHQSLILMQEGGEKKKIMKCSHQYWCSLGFPHRAKGAGFIPFISGQLSSDNCCHLVKCSLLPLSTGFQGSLQLTTGVCRFFVGFL